MKNPVRIIPRLEFKGPNLIKGLEFEGNRCLGVLKHFVDIYKTEKADEVFFYDIVASLYQQSFNFNDIEDLKINFKVPVTFCGGIKSEDDINHALKIGADKVSINTAFLKNIKLLDKFVNIYGSPTIISNIEYYFDGHDYLLLGDFGRTKYKSNIIDWIKSLIDHGIGEIHILNVKYDGYGNGPDLKLINEITSISSVPIVYGCGIGKKQDVLNLIKETDVSGISIASILHYANYTKIDRSFASHYEDNLRNGRSIDSGNIEFINSGYGGFKDIFVEPTKLNQLKEYLRENNCRVR